MTHPSGKDHGGLMCEAAHCAQGVELLFVDQDNIGGGIQGHKEVASECIDVRGRTGVRLCISVCIINCG